LPTGVGLGVEAAVGGVVVFGLAGGAHWEDGHGGLGTVVGDAAGDGEAGAAVGAVEEGIAVAAVGGIEEFVEAVGAGGGVGGDAGGDATEDFAGEDAEAGFGDRVPFLHFDAVDAGEGWCFGAEAGQEGIEVLGRALELNGDAVGVVGDEAGEMFLMGEAVGEGAKAYALDDAADDDRTADWWGWVVLGLGWMGQRLGLVSETRIAHAQYIDEWMAGSCRLGVFDVDLSVNFASIAKTERCLSMYVEATADASAALGMTGDWGVSVWRRAKWRLGR